MEFRTPSVQATPLNLVRVKVDFWGIFRLSFKSNLGSGIVLGPNSLCDFQKWHVHHRLSQPYSKLNLFTSRSHFPAFPVVLFFSLRPLINSREFLWFSFAKTQSSRNPCSLCALVIPWCWSQLFCRTAGTRSAKRVLVGCNKTQLPAIAPFVKSLYGAPHNWRQTSPSKSLWRRSR